MPLKKSKGNMYDWVTHTHSHLRGKCSHECGYCYVQAMAKRFPNMNKLYSGDTISVDESELNVDYGSGKLVFIEHMNDLFAQCVSDEIIIKVLNHCRYYSKSDYVLQTKNPQRYKNFTEFIPCRTICGTTIESNRVHDIMGNSPSPFSRIVGIREASQFGFETFITIEPILKFDLSEFVDMIEWASPTFVNIGADSKGHGLDEPNYDEIMKLYEKLCEIGVEVRKKINLERLAKNEKNI